MLGNYPTKEGTSFWSLKLDHIWNSKNTSFMRANVSPSLFTGIQVNAQNQNFGQNAGNRTSNQQTRDLAIVGQHTTSFRDICSTNFAFNMRAAACITASRICRAATIPPSTSPAPLSSAANLFPPKIASKSAINGPTI